MPRKKRLLAETGFYHLINRGIGRQIIFENDMDYYIFLRYLRECKEVEDFEIIAYCLMDNHFHLLIHTTSSPSNIMKRLCTKYARYYNSRYEHVGHLFQDRFKSEVINDEQYFLNVIKYIHNNPEKAGICKTNKYRWSSYIEYQNSEVIINPSYLLDLIGGRNNFEEFSQTNLDMDCLDYEEKAFLSHKQINQIVNTVQSSINKSDFQNMDKEKRNSFIRELKAKGLSIRQIERITGIGRGIIARV